MAEMSESEYRVLNALSETTRYSVSELAGNTGVPDRQVQQLIERFARDGLVRWSARGARTEYWLTPSGVVLTDAERSVCSSSLTRQHRQGRLGWDDLARRRALLKSAVTHGQLTEVFHGLEMPQLNGVPAPARVSLAKKVGLGVQALIFVLIAAKGIHILFTAAHWVEFLAGLVFIGLPLYRGYQLWRDVSGRGCG